MTPKSFQLKREKCDESCVRGIQNYITIKIKTTFLVFCDYTAQSKKGEEAVAASLSLKSIIRIWNHEYNLPGGLFGRTS